MISSILLVPSDEHRDALLGSPPGFFRSEPPIMWRCPGVPWGVGIPLMGGPVSKAEGAERALVLAHGGKVVREGRDRAAYVLAAHEGLDASETAMTWWSRVEGTWGLALVTHGATGDAGRSYLDTEMVSYPEHERYGCRDQVIPVPALAAVPPLSPDVIPAWSLATVCAARGLGRVVLLDRDSRVYP